MIIIEVQSAGETVGLVVFFQSSKLGAAHADPEVETTTAPPAMEASTLNCAQELVVQSTINATVQNL